MFNRKLSISMEILNINVKFPEDESYSDFKDVQFSTEKIFEKKKKKGDFPAMAPAGQSWLPGQWALYGHDPHQLCLFAAGSLGPDKMVREEASFLEGCSNYRILGRWSCQEM